MPWATAILAAAAGGTAKVIGPPAVGAVVVAVVSPGWGAGVDPMAMTFTFWNRKRSPSGAAARMLTLSPGTTRLVTPWIWSTWMLMATWPAGMRWAKQTVATLGSTSMPSTTTC